MPNLDQSALGELLTAMRQLPPEVRQSDTGPAFGTVYSGLFREFDASKERPGMVCGELRYRNPGPPTVPFKPMTTRPRHGKKAKETSLEIDPTLLGPCRRSATGQPIYPDHSFILYGWPDILIKRRNLQHDFERKRILPPEVITEVQQKMAELWGAI